MAIPGFDAVGHLALAQVPGRVQAALSCDAGAFTLAGQDSTFRVSMPGGAGAFALTGVAAALTPALAAGAGSFALAGQNTVFQVSAVASAGAFVLSGQTAILTPGLRCGTGEFTLTGQEVVLFLGNLTNTDLIQLPVDYYMEDLPQYRGLGRTYEPSRGRAGETVRMSAGPRGRIAGPAPTVTRTTNKRGYD
jgi:hypothetical protein